MSFVRTVCGDVAPHQLGITHAHEHTVILRGKSSELYPPLLLDQPDKTVRELIAFYKAGGRSLVDAQPIGPERSPILMRELSQKSGVQIIATTGFHRECFYPEHHLLFDGTVEKIANRLEHEITFGMIEDRNQEQTDVQAGLIKLTSEYHHIPPLVHKIAEPIAQVHRKTGVPILTHTEHGTCLLEQIEMMERLHVPASSMILCHADRNPDRFLHREVAASGAFLVYDGIARTKYGPDSVIIDLICDLFDVGLGGQLMLAMDVATRTTWKEYGGGPGLSYLLTRFIPRLRTAGLTEGQINLMLVQTPQKAFAFRV